MALKGPTSGQIKVLLSLGEDPADFQHDSRVTITQFLRGRLHSLRSASNDFADGFRVRRVEDIRKKNLKPGMLVSKKGKGMIGRDIRNRIDEITEQGYIKLVGVEGAFPPFLIFQIPEKKEGEHGKA